MKLQNDIRNDNSYKSHNSGIIMLVRKFFGDHGTDSIETVNELLQCRMADYKLEPLNESEVRELVYLVNELTLFLSELNDRSRRLESYERGFFLGELGFDFIDIEKAVGYRKD